MASDAEDGVSPDDFKDQEAEVGDDSMAEPSQKDPAHKTESNASSDAPNGITKTKSNDPTRPRRKKARRACFACQRAHLTCGDERPCQRCIKRGLQDACQDGIRKKAKYLHDAPPEALIPPALGGTYNLNGNQTSTAPTSSGSMMQTSVGHPRPTPMYYSDNQPMTVEMYSQMSNPQQMQHPQQNSATNSYGPHTPISPPYTTAQQSVTMQAPPTQGHQHNQNQSPSMQYHFDPSDPAFFFDISNLNFDNRYGALEFGMLGHMASGANETQNVDGLPSMNQIHQSFNNNPNIAHDQQQHNHQPQSLLFGQDAMMDVDWETQRHPAPTSNAALETPHNTPIIQSADRPEPPANGPYAYAIGARPNSLSSASPISISQDIPHHDLNSPALFSGQTSGPYARSQTSTHHPVQHLKPVDMLSQAHSQSTNSRKRAHDGDHIYDTVKQPYPYTVGFHRLLSYIKTHFSKDKIIRIAQALAAIRPALITFAQQLTEKDLIFMEVSVQRKLFAYDDFIKAYGTPTVIARRDGAIVAVSQEFVILTGWSKDVLLGKKPNLNTNHGGTSSTGASTTGTNSGHGTRRESVEPESNRENSTAGHTNKTGTSSSQKQNISMNVLIAEIMSQETVAEFYEDYARLAFGDPMGRALRRGKLLKYRTADHQAPFERATVDALAKAGVRGDNGSLSKKDGKSKKEDSHGSNGRIAGEGAFVRLGEKEGVVDCMYCWNVRRDNFEVPQLIVMNFLPVINPTTP